MPPWPLSPWHAAQCSRSFTLPEGVDPEHAQAELASGVLTVSLPKRPELKPRKIEVQKLAAKGDKAHA